MFFNLFTLFSLKKIIWNEIKYHLSNLYSTFFISRSATVLEILITRKMLNVFKVTYTNLLTQNREMGNILFEKSKLLFFLVHNLYLNFEFAALLFGWNVIKYVFFFFVQFVNALKVQQLDWFFTSGEWYTLQLFRHWQSYQQVLFKKNLYS